MVVVRQGVQAPRSFSRYVRKIGKCEWKLIVMAEARKMLQARVKIADFMAITTHLYIDKDTTEGEGIEDTRRDEYFLCKTKRWTADARLSRLQAKAMTVY